ncbi:hypothetical protein, partial [Pseudomonas syringae]|uniref:hypothetical protein n=1 Tax=Pseudomonas syringae TaxID=317 RepID=UPI001F3529D0
MSALRVGGNEVILASSLLVPEGDSVEFDLDVGESEKFFCIFKFEREPGSTDKPITFSFTHLRLPTNTIMLSFMFF